MDTHAPPQADADYLTAALRKAGALDRGRVVAAKVVHAFPTVLSKLHRLKLEYEGAEDAPRHLYLKTDLPGRPGRECELLAVYIVHQWNLPGKGPGEPSTRVSAATDY